MLTQADNIHTLIFDEIDQGIGGRVGMTVGEKLWRLGRAHQVFVVTHLPQLAAFGDQHYRVRKQVTEGRTVTLVDPLTDESRLEELAQMLGSLSEANRVAAQETLVTGSTACFPVGDRNRILSTLIRVTQDGLVGSIRMTKSKHLHILMLGPASIVWDEETVHLQRRVLRAMLFLSRLQQPIG